MNYRSIVAAVAAFAVFVFAIVGVFIVIDASYADSERSWDTEENISEVAADTTYTASPEHVPSNFGDDEIVTNGSDAQLAEGEDYTWNTSSGELMWLNSSAVENSTNATLEYGYRGHMEAAKDVHTVHVNVTTLLPWFALVFAAFVVLILFAVAGGAILTNNQTILR